MMYIASVFAQLEREVIAERIRDNMIELAKTGRWLGGQEPTGFKSERYELVDIYESNESNILEKKQKKACKLTPNDEERKVIEIIATQFLELKSLSALETYLIQHDIVSRTGAYFSTGRLRTILTNFVYATYDQDIKDYLDKKGICIYTEQGREEPTGQYGLMTYNKMDGDKNLREMKDWIFSVGLHPGYIKGIDFIKIQEIIEKNASKRYRANCKNGALLSGLLRCKECGSYMRPKATGNQPKDSKARRYYYTCELKDRSKGNKCHGANIIGLTIDEVIVQKLKDIFVPSSEIYQELKEMSLNKDSNNNTQNEIEELEKRYTKNQEAIHNLINNLKFMDSEVAPLINEELKKLHNENENLQAQINDLKAGKSLEDNKKNSSNRGADFLLDIIDNCFSTFDTLDLKFKKDILRIFIKDIYGNGNHVEVNFLNTKLEESQKKLFSNDCYGDNLKKN